MEKRMGYVILFIVIIIAVRVYFPPEDNTFVKNVLKGLPNHSPIFPMDAWQVAVVGNGPISENDRKKINECQCIIRFNDAKNRRPNERTDLQIVRRQLGIGRIDRMFWKYYVPKGVYTMYITEPWVNLSFHGLENPLGSIDVGKRGSQLRDDISLFPGCNKCNDNPCTYSLTDWGPSSGALMIDSLESMDNIKQIHVFGMNWNPLDQGARAHHLDFEYPDLVKNCCKKCIFHKTPTDEYIDTRTDDYIDLR